MKIAKLLVFCLFLVFICGFGCTTSKPTPDPLAGYRWCSLVVLDKNKAISDDCHDYINKLPPEERKYVGGLQFFEDSTGQHAVVIEVDLKPNAWSHVLVYDKDNKRINVVKYIDHQFRS